MRQYIGLSCYDNLSAAQLSALGMDGAILGDAFCQRRMFRHGAFGLCQTAGEYRKAGMEILYQTGMYLTDVRFEEEKDRVAYLYEICDVRSFLVQDVGFAAYLSERYPDTRLIWSQLGRNRGGLTNSLFPPFLQHIGVHAMACTTVQRIEAARKCGISPCVVVGQLQYHTLSRECYNRYLNNCFDGQCHRECLSGEMVLQKNNWKMTVDGYVLGQSIHYDSGGLLNTARSCDADLLFYAESFETAAEAATRFHLIRKE